jgi:hypothetical protein
VALTFSPAAARNRPDTAATEVLVFAMRADRAEV